jgi:predicted O-methyltransferase YrrM
MRKILIDDFLLEHDVPLDTISLGEIDEIGELCAKKKRSKDSPLYNQVGAYFRPNYERGILIYSLIKRYKLRSFLEVGFGRGLSAICAAKAFHDIGTDGTVTTIDLEFDQTHLKRLAEAFPKEWLQKIDLKQGDSRQVLKELTGPWDIVYIDGDHRAAGVQADWDLIKSKWNSICVFDDYHLPTKKEKDIECAQVIDKIDPNDFAATKELVITDRRIFLDDRGYTNDQVDYGQVCLIKKSIRNEDW